ncbi:FMN-binding protein [uncultured Prevotella sp.]|jgi:electron transport complex protein RnfG|uniref:FMN-binding protein n=1 Tax=uncultured Prevotella sp. TaxID=159272 RepID=UPI0025D6D4C7|nr:FMN-binding protein [uncultured Prevotella sp.]
MKIRKLLATILILSAAATVLAADKVIRKQNNGTFVVNTSTIAKDVRGYNGPTPLEIHIKDDRIVKIIILSNNETRNYFERVKKNLMSKWIGMKVNKVLSTDIDAVTGATYTSDAVTENMKRALEYYKKNAK